MHKLGEQLEMLECEIEQAISGGANKKSRKVDKDKQRRLDDLKHRLDRHKFHLQNLEIMMRLITNDSINAEKVCNVLFSSSLNYKRITRRYRTTSERHSTTTWTPDLMKSTMKSTGCMRI